MNITEIKECQQNRHPVLFIDKIVSYNPGESAHAIKCYSYNEWFFPGHFEDEPMVPGFILVEMMAQTFLMTFLTIDEYKGKKANGIKINNVRFFEPVIPGDLIDIKAELLSFKRGIAKGSVKAFNGETTICSANFVVGIPDLIKQLAPKK